MKRRMRLNVYFYFRNVFSPFIAVCLSLFICLTQNLFSQEYCTKYIKNFTPETYGHYPQNWTVVQDRRGIIYVGNNEGLLEYDGVSWRLLPIPNRLVCSLAIDKDTGTIYIGGKDEIGFLDANSNGSLEYKSLRGHLQDRYENLPNAWEAYSTKEGIYFNTSKYLFRWNAGQIEHWEPAGEKFYLSFLCEGKLYIREKKIGLRQMKGDSLRMVSGGETFSDKRVFMMVTYDSEKLLIGTESHGFYLYDGIKSVPFTTEADKYVKDNGLYHGIGLSSGDFALATKKGGLVIIDHSGGLKYIFNEHTGLQDNNVRYVYEDNQGNLWLALNKGISKIEYRSPFSIYDKRADLPGFVLSVTRHGPRDILYAGSTSGLYYLSSSSKKFQPVLGISSNCWFLLSNGDSLLAATSRGVVEIKNNSINKITEKASYVLHRSNREKKRIWVGTRDGLISLYLENNQWIEEHKLDIQRGIRTIAEDKNGNLWLGIRPEGVLRVDSPGKEPILTTFDTSHGLPGGKVNVFTADERVLFATEKGIYHFDKKTRRFFPDAALGEEFAGGEKGKNISRIFGDRNGDIWIHSENRNTKAIRQPDGTYKLYNTPFLRIPPAEVNTIYPDPDGNTIWFGGNDGLICYDKKARRDYHHDFPTLIRKVVVNGKLVFDGYETKINSNSKFKLHLSPIDYKDRNLHFEFAAPSFEDESATQYHCLLEGYDENWSAWASESIRDYTNLDAGLYTFRVRAKNTYHHLSGEAGFRFKVLPPWFKTWWAISAYILILFFLMFFIIKWRSEKLEREKRKLERVVKERTKEIEEKNQQLEEQAEKLKEMDKVKSRFFANISHEFRTPLTLIMGPLEQMLSENRAHKQQKNLNLMLRNSQRLLGLINQLLELSKFESGKMKLQASRHNIIPFLKGIVASFEPVAVKNDLALIFHPGEENISLYFDPEKLEEVIFNLLSNAVKFTPPGGKITVIAAENPAEEETFPSGSADISVSDTGPGIPRDQLEHIFDRFYQTDITYEHHPKGSGIGLAIAKEIVELHHGKIDVHSSEGKGTEFIIRFPMGKEHLKSDQIVDMPLTPSPRKTPPEIPTSLKPTAADRDGTETTGDEKEIQSLKPGKNIILVVEDSADIRDYIRGSLQLTYTLVEAKDGQEGLQKAQQIIPDLIISDVMMPGIDGYELCRQLKAGIETSHIPIILLTAKASEENVIEGLETGADDYITKPFSTRILSARIKNLIDLRRHMQQTIDREMTLQPAKISVSPIDKKFLKKLKEVIKENISEPEFNIEALCKKMDMSQPTIYRKIHALTGESPTEFIRSYRLKKGAELLKNNFGSVLEVAFEVGFSSAAYFTKCFKKKFHQLPSSYQAAESE